MLKCQSNQNTSSLSGKLLHNVNNQRRGIYLYVLCDLATFHIKGSVSPLFEVVQCSTCCRAFDYTDVFVCTLQPSACLLCLSIQNCIHGHFQLNALYDCIQQLKCTMLLSIIIIFSCEHLEKQHMSMRQSFQTAQQYSS